MMIFQNFGDMNPASDGANQAMNIKLEEVSETEEEEEEDEEEAPMPITFLEIKAEPEVSCMSLYIHC
jgi:hypothetical protein